MLHMEGWPEQDISKPHSLLMSCSGPPSIRNIHPWRDDQRFVTQTLQMLEGLGLLCCETWGHPTPTGLRGRGYRQSRYDLACKRLRHLAGARSATFEVKASEDNQMGRATRYSMFQANVANTAAEILALTR